MEILKFETTGCAPCLGLTHWLRENGVNYNSYNIKENLNLVKLYNLKTVPVLIRLEGGVEVGRVTGFNDGKLEDIKILLGL